LEHFPESFSVMRIETYGTPFDFSDLKFTFLRDPICLLCCFETAGLKFTFLRNDPFCLPFETAGLKFTFLRNDPFCLPFLRNDPICLPLYSCIP